MTVVIVKFIVIVAILLLLLLLLLLLILIRILFLNFDGPGCVQSCYIFTLFAALQFSLF